MDSLSFLNLSWLSNQREKKRGMMLKVGMGTKRRIVKEGKLHIVLNDNRIVNILNNHILRVREILTREKAEPWLLLLLIDIKWKDLDFCESFVVRCHLKRIFSHKILEIVFRSHLIRFLAILSSRRSQRQNNTPNGNTVNAAQRWGILKELTYW
jgi:hypothetical protein